MARECAQRCPAEGADSQHPGCEQRRKFWRHNALEDRWMRRADQMRCSDHQRPGDFRREVSPGKQGDTGKRARDGEDPPDLALRQFRRRHTYRPFAQERSLRFPDGDCTFLRDRQCSIYETRPQQCRTWPFWEENLDPQVWQDEVASFCPGVGRGRLYTAEEIEAVISGDDEVSEGG